MPFDLDKEKMRCLIVLDDALARHLSSAAGPAFWRGFILKNRVTHQVHALMRYKYKDGQRNWFELRPKNQSSVEAATEELRCGIEDVLKLAMRMYGVVPEAVERAIHCYYPPDDDGDPARTALWLDEQGLVEIEIKQEGEDC
jgi:hypothetical protein